MGTGQIIFIGNVIMELVGEDPHILLQIRIDKRETTENLLEISRKQKIKNSSNDVKCKRLLSMPLQKI